MRRTSPQIAGVNNPLRGRMRENRREIIPIFAISLVGSNAASSSAWGFDSRGSSANKFGSSAEDYDSPGSSLKRVNLGDDRVDGRIE